MKWIPFRRLIPLVGPLFLGVLGCAKIELPRENLPLDRVAKALENSRKYPAAPSRERSSNQPGRPGRGEGESAVVKEEKLLGVESYRPLREAVRALYLRQMGDEADESHLREILLAAHRAALEEVEFRYFRFMSSPNSAGSAAIGARSRERLRDQLLRISGTEESELDDKLLEALQLIGGEGHESSLRIQNMFRFFFKTYVKSLDPWGGLVIPELSGYEPMRASRQAPSVTRRGGSDEQSERFAYFMGIRDWNSGGAHVERAFATLNRLSQDADRRRAPLVLDLRYAAGNDMEIVRALKDALRTNGWDESPILVWIDELTRGVPEIFVRSISEWPNVLIVGGPTAGYFLGTCESEFDLNSKGLRGQLYLGCDRLVPDALTAKGERVHLAIPYSQETLWLKRAYLSSAAGTHERLRPQVITEEDRLRMEHPKLDSAAVALVRVQGRLSEILARPGARRSGYTEHSHIADLAREWAAEIRPDPAGYADSESQTEADAGAGRD